MLSASRLKESVALAAGFLVLLTLSSNGAFAAIPATVSLVSSDTGSKPIVHAIGQLKLALERKGVTVEAAVSLAQATGEQVVMAGVAAKAGDLPRLLAAEKLMAPAEAESL